VLEFYSIHVLVTSLLTTFLKFAKEIKAKMTEHGCPMGLVFSGHVNEITFRTILKRGCENDDNYSVDCDEGCVW
jgi:hypothetical protein